LNITLTPDKYSNTTEAVDASFDEIHELFLDRLAYDGPKEGNMMFVMGELKDTIPEGNKINRCDANVITMSALVFDIDNKTECSTVTDPFKFAAESGHKCLLASSASSTRDFPRARLILPSTRPMTPEKEYRRIQCELFNAFKAQHPSLDKDMMTPSQAYYFPQQPLDKVNGYCFVEVFDGPLFDPDEYLKRLPPERVETARIKSVREYEPLSLDQALEALNFFDAGNDKDRFMTCLVFVKNWPHARSSWEAWHVAGSTKWNTRKDLWNSQAKRIHNASYRAVDIGWFVKEGKKRGWSPFRQG
jgi:hypothetical protein